MSLYDISTTVNLRGIEETNQGMPLAKRPAYAEAILAITEVQRQQRNEYCSYSYEKQKTIE